MSIANRIKGSITALITPMKDGKLDFEMIEASLPALPKPDEDGDGGVDREEIEA